MNINKAIQIAKRYKKAIESNGVFVNDMYIFGSVVKKTAQKGSDIDVCVVSSTFGKDTHSERIKLMNIKSTIDESIEPHPFSPRDMRETYNPLIHEILKHGIRVT